MIQKLTLSDFETGANEMRCEPEAIIAVFSVESNGSGFLPDGRLKILFERHKFYKYADRKNRDDWARAFPNICNKKSGGYYGGEDEYKRFNLAFSLDKNAALMSCSIGAGQTMGFNYALLGFRTVDEMWDYAKTGERAQLDLFLRYCRETGLSDELRRHDWAGFAEGYNGADYRRNNYDAKMATAYKKAKARKIDWDKVDSAPTFAALRVSSSRNPALETADYAPADERQLPAIIAVSDDDRSSPNQAITAGIVKTDDDSCAASSPLHAENGDAGPAAPTLTVFDPTRIVEVKAAQPVESIAPKAFDALKSTYGWLIKVSGAGTGGAFLSLIIAKASGVNIDPQLLTAILIGVGILIVLAVFVGGIGAVCYIVGRFILTNRREQRAHEINVAQMQYAASNQFMGVRLKQ